jgi:zinc protease
MRTVRTIAVAALLPLTAALAQIPSTYRQIKTPPLHQIKLPQSKRIQLANGMVVFLMEDHELPLIRGTARIRGGGRDVPADKAGLVGIFGQSWRTGGTESKTGDQLDDFLEARAAKVETNGGEDSTSVRLDTLKGDFDTVFPVFVDLLQHPAFRQEKIDLAKTQANTAISRRNDEPMGIGTREASKLGYGPDSPYARQPEYSTIASITRDDLLAFHRRYVQPNNIILGLVGDFDTAAMEQKVRQTFESWPRGPDAPKVAPNVGQSAKPGLYFVAKDDVTQSNVYLVHAGTTRNNPDYYPLAVMNEILAGGFSGRLMNHIRSQLGLAYGVNGGVGAEWDHPGLFRVWMGTKSGSTLEAINALRGDIAALQTQPFTDEELTQAKESILNAFVFTIDSKSKILNQQMTLEFYGYPANYWDQYAAAIAGVSAADVARVAKKYVQPNQAALLVVGKDKEFDKPLSTLGTVTPIDVTIPEPGARPATAAPATSNTAGTSLVRKVQDFFGGKAAIDALQSVRATGTMNIRTPQGPMDVEVEQLTRYPDSHRNVMKTPMGEMTMVSTPQEAFMITPAGVQDLPDSGRAGMQNELRQDLITVLKNADKPDYTFTVTGTSKIGDIDAQVVEVSVGGSTFKWYVDPSTGRILRKVAQGRMGEQVTEYLEWKKFGALNLPVGFNVTAGGQPAGGGKLTTVEINPPIDPNAFAKPPGK